MSISRMAMRLQVQQDFIQILKISIDSIGLLFKMNIGPNYPDGKRIKCSEVLVKKMIPMYYVTDIFTFNSTTFRKK